MTLLTNGKVLVSEGAIYEGPPNRVELYNPATGTWPSTDNPGASGTTTLLLNGKVLVAGGGAEPYESSLQQENLLNPCLTKQRVRKQSIGELDGSFLPRRRESVANRLLAHVADFVSLWLVMAFSASSRLDR